MANRKAVVVGAGSISNAWFDPLADEKVEVAGVVDLDASRAAGQIARHKLACKPSDDLNATLRAVRPDFVVDLTVPDAHCNVTCRALRGGCHVLGEKPMAASMAEARRMVRAAERTGKCYMVSQSRRWAATHERLARAIAGRRLGTLTTANCDFYMARHSSCFRVTMDSPLILDMAIHHFDLARMLTGTDPVAVYAHEFNPHGSWYDGDVAASCIFEMTDGVVFTYRGSWCAEGWPTSWHGDWRLIGDRGTLVYERDREPRGKRVTRRTGRGKKPTLEPVKLPPARLKHQAMRGALREMLRYLRTGERPQTECHDNIKSLAMVFAAMESSRKGRRVPVRT
ncbi:MAG: Gfo/Idh/MocA family oxidoreductase [Phycisphaerae bacterium]|nr:Gfo/Idh/MocA family oxidoreductase [Phycisphaerae bacterium]